MEAVTFNLPDESACTSGDSRNGMVGSAASVRLIVSGSFNLFPKVVAALESQPYNTATPWITPHLPQNFKSLPLLEEV